MPQGLSDYPYRAAHRLEGMRAHQRYLRMVGMILFGVLAISCLLILLYAYKFGVVVAIFMLTTVPGLLVIAMLVGVLFGIWKVLRFAEDNEKLIAEYEAQIEYYYSTGSAAYDEWEG